MSLSKISGRLNKSYLNDSNLKELCDELIKEVDSLSNSLIEKIIRKFSAGRKNIYTRDQIISFLRYLLHNNAFSRKKVEKCIRKLKLKPTRSISGVTTVTVLTKPYACPGRCIFCPNDIRMPKSYIATEPGAQRALLNKFSPYNQVFNRLLALYNIGHPLSKIELLVLGGTWSYYPIKYKVWFIYECFKAMNDFSNLICDEQNFTIDTVGDRIDENHLIKFLNSDLNQLIRDKYGQKPYNQLIQTSEYKEIFNKHVIDNSESFDLNNLWSMLEDEHNKNEISNVRCVGLVLETRPDCITSEEVYNMRRLGATKVQIGFQCVDDEINKLNKRGETLDQIKNAFFLLRAGGFKIHGHFMPNLYGSNIEKDIEMYKEIFSSPYLKPDELKIYPTSVIKNTELYEKYQKGEYIPYSTEELQNLISELILLTPEYCRLTRIIRDIPSTEIEAGNKQTNLRETSEQIAQKKGKDVNIRKREIKHTNITDKELEFKVVEYDTSFSTEHFLQFVTKDNSLVGFLRLSLPKSNFNPISEMLNNVAMVRELHVYGPVVDIGEIHTENAQHLGVGTRLLNKAFLIAKQNNFKEIGVISAIGTRKYYLERGFEDTKPWMIGSLI